MFIVHHHQSIFFVLVLVLLILQPALTFETDTNYDFMNTNQKSESTEVYKSKIKYLQQSTSSNNNNNADSTSSINNVKKLTEPVVISSTNTAHHPQYLTYKYRLIQQHHPYSAASYAYPTFTAPAPAQLYHGHQIAIRPDPKNEVPKEEPSGKTLHLNYRPINAYQPYLAPTHPTQLYFSSIPPDSIPQFQDIGHSQRIDIAKQVSANKKSTENIDDVENNNNNNNEDDSPAKLQLKYRLLKEPRVLKLEGATPVASKVLQPAGGSTGSTTGSLIRPTTATTTTLFHHPDYRSLEAEPARAVATSFHPLLDYHTGRIQYSYSPVADIRSIPYLPYYDPSPQGIPYHHPQYYIPVQQHHIGPVQQQQPIFHSYSEEPLSLPSSIPPIRVSPAPKILPADKPIPKLAKLVTSDITKEFASSVLKKPSPAPAKISETEKITTTTTTTSPVPKLAKLTSIVTKIPSNTLKKPIPTFPSKPREILPPPNIKHVHLIDYKKEKDVNAKLKINEKPITVLGGSRSSSITENTKPSSEVKANPIKVHSTSSTLAPSSEAGLASKQGVLEPIEFSEFVRGGHKPLDHRKTRRVTRLKPKARSLSAIFKKDVEENKPAASLFSSIPKKGGDIVNGLRPGYEYEYKVNHKGQSHSHVETSIGGRTEGHYEVALPDGRVQTVKYYVDETGYHPEIVYDSA